MFNSLRPLLAKIDWLFKPINTAMTIVFARFDRLPRYVQHLLFWLIMLSATFNQFYRMFTPDKGPQPNFAGFFFMWPVHLFFAIISFYWLGYYVMPRFWNKGRSIQFFILFCVYWVVNCYQLVYLFKFINKYLTPAPTYVTSRIPAFDAAHWYDFFFDPALLFYNWAFSFSYVLIPLLIKEKRDETKRGERLLSLEQEKALMELSFLKSQINPHFLFNAFNNILTLIRRGDTMAATILADLTDIMRYALYRTKADFVPLQGELTFLHNYLRLESIRFAKSKVTTCTVDGNPMGFAIPPMVIIPFVENAFKHGFNSALIEGSIDINIKIDVEMHLFFMTIYNSKVEGYVAPKEGGIGIANVRKRLDLLLGNKYTMTLTDSSNSFTVYLELPLSIDSSSLDSVDDEEIPAEFSSQLIATRV